MPRNVIDNEVLPYVRRPSRYLGTELNSVHKDLAEVDTRVCLCYPDLYDLALGNLGLLVLYGLLNDEPGVWAERAYAPAPELEELLRARGLPLFSVESRTPLRDFDLVGFTLQYELTYTNLLNMLDLGGLALKAADRGDDMPLVVAGGPGALNPAPLTDFVDAFALGDGEDLALELVAAVRETSGLPREQRLARLSEVDGVYVPGVTQGMVSRRVVTDLEHARLPLDYLVPFTQQVHDRVSLEVLRGCTHGCRFCQAGMVTRPVRERSAKLLEQSFTETLKRTGYEGLALTSLNTCDHSEAAALVAGAVATARRFGADISLPSVRLDAFSVELADQVRSLRATGLTFAPEAATDRLRRVINKSLSEEDLLETTREVFSRGWDQVKLYFMVGLPTERDEDVAAIAELTNRVLREGRQVNRRARINLGVSTFIPKPHTPFQWERQLGLEETRERQALLRGRLKKNVIKFGRHDAQQSFLEGVVSRADTSFGRALLAAFKQGCRLDGWTEHFDFEKWQRAFEAAEFDAEAQLRERALDEPLPWHMVDALVSPEWLREEAVRARAGEWSLDCRSDKCHQCGVRERVEGGCQEMLRRAQAARAVASAAAPKQPRRREPPPPVQKIRFQFSKSGRLRWLSHLETQNALLRALRRAGTPVALTQGFHPHPRLALGAALGVGVASQAEFADVVLTARQEVGGFVRQLNAVLPEGLAVTAASVAPLNQRALMAETKAETFRAVLPKPPAELAERLAKLLDSQSVVVERWHKKGPKQIDLRPMIQSLQVTEDGVEFTLVPSGDLSARPGDILTALGIEDAATVRVTKTGTRVRVGEQWYSPLSEEVLTGK